MDRVREVIGRIQVHDDPERFRACGVDVRFGAARFVDPHRIRIGGAGDGETVRGRRFVIATGSSPAVPPIEGLDVAGHLTNETVFELDRLPRRLAVLGGGPVGLELAQAFARLGSEVTVIEAEERVLAREDPELAAELTEALRAEGLTVLTRTAVRAVRVCGDERILQCDAAAQDPAQDPGPGGREITVDEILVATGRRPNVADLGLEHAGVAHGPAGIRVDARMRTSARHIHACGDCCGPFALTHAAEYQAGIVIANAVFRWPRKADYRALPRATFTDPELAQVGLTEASARERGLDVEVARFPFRDVDRALAEGSEHGLAKLVVHKGRLVGASLLGPRAGELIHEAVLAMQARLRIGAISAAVHAYPTLSQIHRRAVNSLYAPRLFAPRTRRLVRWLNRLLP